MSKATSQAFSSYRRNRTVLSFRERYRLTVFVSNGTVAVMAQRGVSLKSVLTCYEKNKMIFFFIWAVIDFLTINISWFLLNIKQHPSPISRKPQTVLNVWMAWIVCIALFSYHKCACPMSRAIAATFWPRGRRALRARRPRGPNVITWLTVLIQILTPLWTYKKIVLFNGRGPRHARCFFVKRSINLNSSSWLKNGRGDDNFKIWSTFWPRDPVIWPLT